MVDVPHVVEGLQSMMVLGSARQAGWPQEKDSKRTADVVVKVLAVSGAVHCKVEAHGYEWMEVAGFCCLHPPY